MTCHDDVSDWVKLGVWPVADATPGGQEQMPVEETANLLLIAEWLAIYTGRQHTSLMYPTYKNVSDIACHFDRS